MSEISEMTRDKWIMSTFPEWGTWLTEEIDRTEVEPGSVSMWWLGCTGIWMKTPGDANITIDLWSGNGKRTHGNGKMAVGHQMANMAGVRDMQPNLRAIPFVIDPFAVEHVDAVLATHYHQDHMSKEFAAHVVRSAMMTRDESATEIPVPFVGPQKSVDTWVRWGVPQERCIVVHPGDVIRIKDLEIVVLDSFDRTCITTTDSTGADREELRGVCPMDMDEKAVNYLIRTPGGNIYHSGDSHYSIRFAAHGKQIARDYGGVDVAFGSYGCNPVGMQDKMESGDILRMAEGLKAKVVIPIHYDVWTNFQADLEEIKVLWQMRRDRLDYSFHPFFWEVGGHYTYPADRDRLAYHHDRGFHDCFEHEPNVPFPSVL
ncbi:L-ascorbate 6-phosphate lactonase [Coriobacterium glomerans PW2]|uniref:L-ascorbate 6-phosphate lactonase n=1 Tax=Coriobacterium glomerans (strain ATCC 49209 / DSM 20642 / JCM 10262 / PW2) TaxID=700015 RepID=F2N7C7_CORGP|nr:L-ascorbate 6-phosphate lactonase [Coriobacterium glomerans]AEB06602.1 L-ascorbate 6-phosphate lactonase [Coriobacterium glomerans PW2]